MGLSTPLPLVAEAERFRLQTKSRLPSFRMVDLDLDLAGKMTLPSLHLHPRINNHNSALTKHQQLPPLPTPTGATTTSVLLPVQSQPIPLLSPPPSPIHHSRNHSTGTVNLSTSRGPQPCRVRSQTISDFSSIIERPTLDRAQTSDATGKIPAPAPAPASVSAIPPRRKVPASNSRHDFGLDGPPPAMLTQRSLPLENSNSTTTTSQTQDWVASIAQDQPPPPSLTSAKSSRSSTGSTQLRPLILPIRAFKPSTRRSLEMAAKRASATSNSMDPDSTIRALEGFEEHRPSNQGEHEDPTSDESDLFLRAAREEELSQRASLHSDRLIRSDKRRVGHSFAPISLLPRIYIFYSLFHLIG